MGVFRTKELLKQQSNFLVQSWKNPNQQTVQPVSFLSSMTGWWNAWINDPAQKARLDNIIRYLVEAVDDFVNIVLNDLKPEEASAQQSVVLGYIKESFTAVYDATIVLPWWLKPFGGRVRTLAIEVICPVIVNFLLSKYSSV